MKEHAEAIELVDFVNNMDADEYASMDEDQQDPEELRRINAVFTVLKAVEELLGQAEKTANMLRGMTMDPAIPVHAKEVMRLKITELDNIVENYVS
jgi:uncharacterized protein (UPF0147 family)